MPKYTPAEDEMDSSYSAEPVTPPEEQAAPPQSVDEQNSEASDVLIEKSKLPEGCKVGDTYTFKVTKDFGDEASLALVKNATSEEEPEEPMSAEGQELTELSEKED